MWWQIVTLVSLAIVGCFAFVLVSGAPYVPTLKTQIETAFALAKLKPNMTVIELGCGDGRILIAAAEQGLKVVGYELNPLMFLISLIRTRKYKKKVQVKWGNFWRQTWPKADAIYVFLLPRLMDRLDQKIVSEGLGRVKVISFAFSFPKRQPTSKKDGVLLYEF